LSWHNPKGQQINLYRHSRARDVLEPFGFIMDLVPLDAQHFRQHAPNQVVMLSQSI